MSKLSLSNQNKQNIYKSRSIIRNRIFMIVKIFFQRLKGIGAQESL
jgi:hypothetical protein